MLRAAFTTLGCKVNQYETQRILEAFEARGFAVVPFGEPADVHVINTCSVTATGESKSWQTARRAARLGGKVVVTGCAVEIAARRGEPVAADVVVPNRDKLQALDHLLAAFPELADQLSANGKPPTYVRPVGRTRATVKLQDGCDVFCSYCSIPYTRSHQFSRPADEVREEVRKLANCGYREVVLTGVLVGDYGPATGSGGPDLPGLIEQLARIDGLERIRISSIETTQVSDRLLELIAGEPKLCPHLHIPLQSGDDGVLRDMNRPYRRDEYLALCERAQRAIPGLAVTTDILVGFPTETDEAIENTLDVVRRVCYLAAHVFRYSPRPGTPAEAMGDRVPPDVKVERSKRVAEAAVETGLGFRRRFVGQTVQVLAEAERCGFLHGHTGNYIEVGFAGDASLSGLIVPVRIVSATPTDTGGEAVSLNIPRPRTDAEDVEAGIAMQITADSRPHNPNLRQALSATRHQQEAT